MWDNHFVVQQMTTDEEAAAKYRLSDVELIDQAWNNPIPGTFGLGGPTSLPEGYLDFEPLAIKPATVQGVI